jgi:acetyltransferase
MDSPARHPLEPFFSPRSVAVIGGSERPGSVGRTLMWNLLTSPFGGALYPVNEKHSHVMGIRTWPRVGDIREPIDLAVVVTPAASVPQVIRECASAGVRAAVVVSAGFKEVGPQGEKLEREILAIARGEGMRLVGPNCLGVMCPKTGLNATFAATMAKEGSVAFLSQSGALQTAILDWSVRANVGFSAFVSLGSMLDVGWGDLIDYLDQDGRTKSILIYMESVGDARAFLSASREVALRKPIIVLKGGRTAPAARAAASHTGTLAGSDQVLTAAFRRSGVLRVDTIADLFDMADVLAKQPRPAGKRLTIVTNAGGPAVLATDALVAGGGEAAQLSAKGLAKLDELLPAQWSRGNPIDVLGDASPQRIEQAVAVAAAEEDSDAQLVILTPQQMTDPLATATALALHARQHPQKPLLASWMGGDLVAAGRRALSEGRVPCFDFPDTAARIFNYMWKYSYNLRGLYETPSVAEEQADGGALVERLVREAREGGRTLLTETESKRVVAAYGIPVVETVEAATPDAAVALAGAMGYPVVLKLHSRTLTHKTRAGGVRLDLRDEGEVRAAFASIREAVPGPDFGGVSVQRMVKEKGIELIVGSSIDAQFGPVLLFGAGGTLVELLHDRSLSLPPLNTTLARRMMEQTRVYELLDARQPELEKLLVRFSQLVVENPGIKEIDVNPLLASAQGLVALDARVVLHAADESLPSPAIAPYPSRYVSTATLRDGQTLSVRPIRPEDEPRMVRFHETLSEQSVYYRYAGFVKLDTRVSHERLSRLSFIDYAREMALIAEHEGEIVAVARLVRLRGTQDAEFALVVNDAFQHQGLGRALLEKLFAVGRDWGLSRITAEILGDNYSMRRICQQLGFKFEGPTGAVKELA